LLFTKTVQRTYGGTFDFDSRKVASMRRDYSKVLENFDTLPDDAVLPAAAVTLIHPGVTLRTIRRVYPTVRLTQRLLGVRVGDLRAMGRGELKVK